jgi:hypothetical protein
MAAPNSVQDGRDAKILCEDDCRRQADGVKIGLVCITVTHRGEVEPALELVIPEGDIRRAIVGACMIRQAVRNLNR